MQYSDISTNQTVKPAGYYQDIPRDEYDAHPGMNASKLKLFQKTTLHALHQINRPDNEYNEALTIGSATHSYILEPELFHKEFFVMKDKINRRTKEGKAQWNAALEECGDRGLLRVEHYQTIKRMAESVARHEVASDLICCGDSEATFFTGTNYKCRIDKCDTERDLIVDLKTCITADLVSVQQSVRKYHYALQARHYLNCYQEVMGRDARFVFVFVEKAPPHDVNCIELCEGWLGVGQAQIDKAMNRIADMKMFGPKGYSNTITTLEVPSYLAQQAETTGD